MTSSHHNNSPSRKSYNLLDSDYQNSPPPPPGDTETSHSNDGSSSSQQENNDASASASRPSPLKSIKNLKPDQLLWLFKLGLKQWPLLLVGTLSLVVAVGANLLVPSFVGNMIDSALSEETGTELRRLVLIIAAFVAINGIFTFIRATTFNIAAERVVAHLRKQLFQRILVQEIAFFDEKKTGDLLNRLSSDTKALEAAVTVNVSMCVRNLLGAVGGLIILFVLSWRLALVMLATVPAFILMAVVYGRFVQKLAKRFQKALADASNVAEESISNVRTVRSFSREPRQIGLYAEAINVSYRIATRLAFARGSFAGSGIFLGNLCLVIVIWYGGTLVLSKEMSIGDLTSFLLYTINIAVSIGVLSSLLYEVIKALGATKEIHDLLHREPQIPTVTRYSDDELISTKGTQNAGDYGGSSPRSASPPGSSLMLSKSSLGFMNPPSGSLKGNVEFSHVYFSYPSRPQAPVLRDLNLKIEAGTVVALVGSSGAGKSTLGCLLQRFYDVDRGEVSIDGFNVASMEPEFLHENIAVVEQEPCLLDASIRDNILFGNPHASQQEIEEACKKANAYDFIMEFPDQFDTMVGSRGHKCSGGQKQRISIARAIISRANILLLDESMSALDAKNERIVQDALDRLMQESNRTTILIAHRLSSVRNADCIFVLEKGQIVESGKHDDLVARDGRYKTLVEAQLLS